jgi:hypothetical protein
MADGLGDSMKLHPAGMRLDTLGPVGPRCRLRQCSRRELGTQGGPCDQGNEQAQRGDDCDGQLPSSSPTSVPKIHSGANVQHETWVPTPASCENDQSPVCVAADGLLAGLRRTAPNLAACPAANRKRCGGSVPPELATLSKCVR